MWYTCTVEHYSAMGKALLFVTWMELKGSVSREVSPERQTSHSFTQVRKSKTDDLIEVESTVAASKGGKGS